MSVRGQCFCKWGGQCLCQGCNVSIRGAMSLSEGSVSVRGVSVSVRGQCLCQGAGFKSDDLDITLFGT